MIGKVKNFLNQTVAELKKVSWPSKNELIGSTVVVIITVIIMAVYIGLVDLGFSKLIGFLMK